jgi:uncharacterized repeat protein (TIGR03833 family)
MMNKLFKPVTGYGDKSRRCKWQKAAKFIKKTLNLAFISVVFPWWYGLFFVNDSPGLFPYKYVYFYTMNGTIRAHIKPGMAVNIILKKDQRSGILTEGIVKDILTSAPKHHRGIKVRLEDGQVGRVQEIIEEA